MAFEARPYTIDIPQKDLDDLKARLDLVRWPEKETVDDWSQGVPLAEAKRLYDHWSTSYDWRRCEAQLNSYDNFIAEIDGLDIHFMHIRSPHEDALPMIMTHGWPGSIIEFLEVIDPLTNPTRHGGDASQAFHLVVPSLPGYGFSGKPEKHGWTVDRTAMAWAALMRGLGYDRYVAQGGDWGSAVSSTMALQKPEGLAAIHLNMLVTRPNDDQLQNMTQEEMAILEKARKWSETETGYSQEQSTKPQTLGYSLVDSPVGQAMWIYEKFKGWTDCDGSPADCFSMDRMLDNIMVYWLTASGASSARLYWESLAKWPRGKTSVPLAYSDFPHELMRGIRSWADNTYGSIIYWNSLDKGGHFAAFEQPDLFVSELRQAFTSLR